MAQGPWTVLGPAVASQTPEAIRGRYIRSFAVLAAVFVPLFLVLVGIQLKFGEIGLILPKILPGVHDGLAAFAQKTNFLARLVAFLMDKTPAWVLTALTFMIPCLILNLMFQLIPAVLVWWEQKVAAHAQVRMGPMSAGLPRWGHGLLQTLADGIKMILKEEIIPAGADKWVHWLAPVIVCAPAYICYAPLPFGDGLAAVNMDAGTLFVMAVSGLSTVGILMAGWGSNSKYSALGGLRAASMVVSYEIPRVISILPVVMWAGTLSLSGIAAAQEGQWAGFLPRWFIFYPVVGQIGYLIYLISTVAETNRVPFDVAEAESELVSGFNTEYSGMKFALFFLAEYAYVFLGAAVGTVLFLGGGAAPWKFLEFIPSYVWFFAKTLFQVFFILLFRWTYPRMRVDRIMEFCWKFLLPWSLVNVFLAGALILWRLK